MSMKRLAILAAVGQGTLNGTSVALFNMTTTSGGGGGRTPGGGSLHGNVNVLLGGAMLSGVILVVFLVCYCCHRNMRKHAPPYPGAYWREPEVPLEVFTLGGQTHCYETSGLFLSEQQGLEQMIRPATPGPPPAYEAVVSAEKDKLAAELDSPNTAKHTDSAATPDESGLPSYEAALRIEAGGYV